MSNARDMAGLSSVNDRLSEVGNSDGALSNRNLIINGAMQVAQRGTSATNVTTNGCITIDRFAVEGGATKAFDLSTGTGPEGFPNSFKYSRNSSTSLATNDYALCIQAIEGQNLQHLKYGTTNAESITVSFWVKSTATGTYALNIYANDSGAARHVTKQYTISSANTWEHKTITFSGDQAGQINNDNGHGLWFQWWLRSGSAYTSTNQPEWAAHTVTSYAAGHTADFMSADNGSWEITGVQLEVGDQSTPFEHRSYSDQLQSCMRYFQWNPSGGGAFNGTGSFAGGVSLPVALRTTPTIINYNNTDAIDELYVQRRNFDNTPIIYDLSPSLTPKTSLSMYVSCEAGAAFQNTGIWMAGHFQLDAEL